MTVFLTWLITVSVCSTFVKLQWIVDKLVAFGVMEISDSIQAFVDKCTVQIFFVSLPGWFVAAVLYIVLSKIYQKKGVSASQSN